jgi:hypothetical protein
MFCKEDMLFFIQVSSIIILSGLIQSTQLKIEDNVIVNDRSQKINVENPQLVDEVFYDNHCHSFSLKNSKKSVISARHCSENKLLINNVLVKLETPIDLQNKRFYEFQKPEKGAATLLVKKSVNDKLSKIPVTVIEIDNCQAKIISKSILIKKGFSGAPIINNKKEIIGVLYGLDKTNQKDPLILESNVGFVTYRYCLNNVY